MTDYVQKLRELAVTKKAGWQQSNCPVVRTTTIETQKAWKSVCGKDEAGLYKKCELAIEAQTRYRRDDRAANGHVPQPKMLSSWLRSGRWEEEIGSHAEIKERAKLALCACGKPVHGPKYTQCIDCLGKDGPFFEDMRRFYRDNELGNKSRAELIALTKKLVSKIGQ